MGVYEERALPTTGMHWVSVIPVVRVAHWPSRIDCYTPLHSRKLLFEYFAVASNDSIPARTLSPIGFNMVNVELFSLFREYE